MAKFIIRWTGRSWTAFWKRFSEHKEDLLRFFGAGRFRLQTSLQNGKCGGDQRPELEAEIRQLGLEEAVVLTGPMDHENVLKEMGKSAFYAMTSLNEGFGFVIIEAMGQGTPVIACDVRVGPRAILCDEKNGFLIPDGDGEVFAQRAIFLLTDSQKRAEMSRAAAERAADFTEEIVMQKWEEIFACRRFLFAETTAP